MGLIFQLPEGADMLSMGFKIQEMVSMYEFDEASGKQTKHYTMMEPAPEALRDLVVIDLWDIKESVEKHRKILEENAEIFSSMCAEELYVAMSVNAPWVMGVFGRMYAIQHILLKPEEPELLLDDPAFLSFVGEQEYARLKPLHDGMTRSDQG